ncbi:MAG: hypothetical protein K2Y51_10360 [Gammaproteobacteria bacterium]|jgi:hypothetical protein|nr:hypothetical protein [Gammaproteobacteria bacterium]
MSLEEIYYVGQTIAVIAIVGSLFALIAQNRAAQKQAQESTVRNQIQGLQNISRALFETPDLAGIWLRGIEGIDRLSAEERVKFLAYVTYALRTWEGLYAQFKDGKFPESDWAGHIEMLRGLQALTGVANVWELRGHAFSADFRRFYESSAPTNEGRKLGSGADQPNTANPGGEKLG